MGYSYQGDGGASPTTSSPYNVTEFDESLLAVGDEDEPIAAVKLLDDTGDGDPAVDDRIDHEIRKLVANAAKATGKGLHADAAAEAAPMGGMHVWPGVKAALEGTFPGWPDNSFEYDGFRSKVLDFLRQAKAKKQDDQKELTAAFFKQNKDTWGYFHRFMTASPFARQLEKPHFHLTILKVMAKGVKYLSDEARAKYLVEIGPTFTRGGEVFDTDVLYQHKIASSVGGSTGQSTIPGKRRRCMWVMTLQGESAYKFYSHFGKMGRFHHSSFAAGSPVMAAGEWFVAHGKLTLINACSGHYQPQPWRFLRAYEVLKRMGAITAETEIQVWRRDNATAKGERRLSALQFMSTFDVQLRTFQLYPGS